MYLLLRNNKQSGPYSLEELKSMGLKAYDLVWLEGKSAAWRYPCEIEELKSFAPAVDEQPFDRFFRRPAPDTTATTTASSASPIPVTIQPSESFKPSSGKRIIYVTMPATTAQRPPVREMTASRETTPPVHQPVPPVRESAPRIIEDYSAQTIEDRAIIEELFPQKKRSPRVMRLLAIAICILALLAAGIFIGLNLNKDTLGLPSRVAAKLPPSAADQAIVHPAVQPLSAPVTTPPLSTTDAARPVDPVPNSIEKHDATSPVRAKATARTTGVRTQKERLTHPISQANGVLPAKDSAAGLTLVHQAPVVEPSHDNTEIADKEAVKAALANQVNVGANGYSVGTFGGITNLQLTVTNRSIYPLDLVIVEVQYIQANKKVFKTEDLYFHGIAAGSALMLEAPKSSRGVRVHYKIMSITSKEIGYTFSGI